MYKLSPSDFAYLYEECKLCYCLKIKDGIYQPSMPMPGVFSALNTRIQGKLVGESLKTLSPDLPDGQVIKQEGYVDSVPVEGTDVFIKGKYDLLIKNTDGTHTLVDLKISQPQVDKIEKYKTQLAAYKFALENPKFGEAIKVSRTGLLIFYPDGVSFENGVAKIDFPPSWLEVSANEEEFLQFARSVDALLKGPLPEESINCKWCQYRHLGENIAHNEKEVTEIPF